MKHCSSCYTQKPFSEFSFKNKEKGKYLSYCKECSRAYHKKHYQLNRSYYLKKQADYSKIIDEDNKSRLIQYLFAHPCVDCGERDIRVLEFDHIKPKSTNISRLLADSFRWSKIMVEINKCEVRCANCHKRRHAKESGWYKNKIYGAIV